MTPALKFSHTSVRMAVRITARHPSEVFAEHCGGPVRTSAMSATRGRASTSLVEPFSPCSTDVIVSTSIQAGWGVWGCGGLCLPCSLSAAGIIW